MNAGNFSGSHKKQISMFKMFALASLVRVKLSTKITGIIPLHTLYSNIKTSSLTYKMFDDN